MGLSYYSLTGAVPAPVNVPGSFLPNTLDYFVRVHILAREGEKDPSPKYPALLMEKDYWLTVEFQQPKGQPSRDFLMIIVVSGIAHGHVCTVMMQ